MAQKLTKQKIKKEIEVPGRRTRRNDIVVTIVIVDVVSVEPVVIQVDGARASPNNICPNPSVLTTDRAHVLLPRLNFIWRGWLATLKQLSARSSHQIPARITISNTACTLFESVNAKILAIS